MKNNEWDVLVIGSGMGSLSAASLMCKDKSCIVIEQNYLAGGCTSSYTRKGYVFESGATTLVGLDDGMPLHTLLTQTGIKLHTRALPIPMQVLLPNGTSIIRHKNIDDWIEEAEKAFGKPGQRKFWETCYKISQVVWKNSTRLITFPPTRLNDYLALLQNVNVDLISSLPYAFFTIASYCKHLGLDKNELFMQFVNEQLMITAQNTASEVSFIFGAAALCYTQYTNHYIDGGLINLVTPIINHIESNGGLLKTRERVHSVTRKKDLYEVETDKCTYLAKYLVSGIPLNNIAHVYKAINRLPAQKNILQPDKLNSAFQVNIAMGNTAKQDCLHTQIILSEPLKLLGSNSLFISRSHPDDPLRSNEKTILSVTTHVKNPHMWDERQKELCTKEIINALYAHKVIREGTIDYLHASTPKDWQKWTGRDNGFVGGYPQFFSRKPWQMPHTRLDGYKAYQVGDTVYPGQGIPGVVLSGILAYEKMKRDWF